MFVALLSTLNPGDEVLVPDPVYLTYSEIPNIAGAVIKKYNLLEENDYQVQVDEVPSTGRPRSMTDSRIEAILTSACRLA